ncbi:MAG: hypothetical protein A4E34_00316 [Methanoregula sp. PtaU1.Bin006]|uniref:hypothetical protein n=1 Tax=Methanoregula sp. PtaU1.Bin006 TaxID=1811681 RepID=UPI0009D35ABE|nr:hypothetical protein [Methanoregula sp. PtaU1.Bin006]OPY36294.1 MAG: hypothetical protein A4E34_00316 [Methanoregula sp. PtaU1.Bin006]
MRCPDCGYDADDAANFCPRCRFQFRDIIEEDPLTAPDTFIDLPERGIITDERLIDEARPEDPDRVLTGKERRQLEVQLLQPSVLIVLIIALFSYSVLYTIPFVPLSIAGQNLGITGIICLACGLVAGLVFYYLQKRSLRNFRYR